MFSEVFTAPGTGVSYLLYNSKCSFGSWETTYCFGFSLSSLELKIFPKEDIQMAINGMLCSLLSGPNIMYTAKYALIPYSVHQKEARAPSIPVLLHFTPFHHSGTYFFPDYAVSSLRLWIWDIFILASPVPLSIIPGKC